MNPTTRLRCTYALMIVFVAVVIVHMGMFITSQVRNGVFQGPVLNYALIDIVIAYTFGQIIWRSTRQLVLSQKWLKHFRANRHDKLTKRLNYKYRDWGTEIIVVQVNAFVALTIGLLRPKIVVSTTVLEMFNDKEVKAILLHERYHCRNYDGLKTFFSTLLADAFGYLPIVKPILRYYQTWQELFADRFAIRQMGTELYLGSVLLKLAKLGNLRRYEAAVHFTDTTLQYRVMQVLEPDRGVNVPLALLKPFLRSCSILLLFMLGGDS
ncbi:M56 family metallopeptidase [Paenibacillus sp. EZ-K15]|uniref:M56 family metallopeptidase n=1 Tax=Paenibacillus sp. EZ-K15 TaxID=2044275 RepID=UPI000BF47BD9|nr:M56 family metallopeptidase [Paenibacillus sp. EZ-K15]